MIVVTYKTGHCSIGPYHWVNWIYGHNAYRDIRLDKKRQ
jgi:hypothetical protein